MGTSDNLKHCSLPPRARGAMIKQCRIVDWGTSVQTLVLAVWWFSTGVSRHFKTWAI